MMASIAGGTRVGRVCSVAFGLIARRVGRVTRIAMVGCASGRTRTIERDTKGAKTRFIAPAYGKFESSSLQQRVRKLSVPLGDDVVVFFEIWPRARKNRQFYRRPPEPCGKE